MDEPGKAEEGLGLLCRIKSAPENFLYSFRTLYRIEYWIIKVDRNLGF